MITLVPYKAEHLSRLTLQPAQEHLRPYLTEENLKLMEGDDSYTMLEDGVPIFCGGVVELWQNRGVMWCYIGGVSRKGFIGIHNITKQYIDLFPQKRLEFYVDENFENGHRWARALGFHLEAPRMEAFTISGSASSMYALIRDRNG